MKKLACTVLWWWIRGLGQQYSWHMKFLWYHYRHKNKDWDRWGEITRYCILYSKLRSFRRQIRVDSSVVGIRCTKNNTLSKTFSERVRITRGVLLQGSSVLGPVLCCSSCWQTIYHLYYMTTVSQQKYNRQANTTIDKTKQYYIDNQLEVILSELFSPPIAET